MSIRDAEADRIVLAEATETGNIFCIAENSAGMTTYGAVDASTAAECTGGEAAWGLGAAPASPEPGAGNIIAGDTTNGAGWTLLVDGERLVLEDGDGVQLADTTTEPESAMSVGTFVFGEGPYAERIVFGVVKPPAETVWPSFADPIWERTALFPSVPGIAERRAVYLLRLSGSYQGGVIAIREPCDAFDSFLLGGNGATPAPVPIIDCSQAPGTTP